MEDGLRLFASIDPFGEGHIVFGDLNVDDRNVIALRDNPLAPAHYLAAMAVVGVVLGWWVEIRSRNP